MAAVMLGAAVPAATLRSRSSTFTGKSVARAAAPAAKPATPAGRQTLEVRGPARALPARRLHRCGLRGAKARPEALLR